MSVDRAARVADTILGILAESVRRDVRDPRVGFVTLTAVRVSPDLRHATVFVSTLGDETARSATLSALDRAAPFLKRALARRAGLRFIPDLRFVADTSIARGSRVEELLGEIDRAREASATGDAPAPEVPGAPGDGDGER